MARNALLGPPRRQPRAHPLMLEVLEANANRQLVAEYALEIPLHLAELEQQFATNVSLIDMQPEVKWYMRPYLLDFLLEAHYLLRLQLQTYFLAWSIIDRYCAKRVVFKKHYQLVGCTALWIAAKYEDKKSRVPTLAELVHLTRNTYDEAMFMQMERHILLTLEWSLSQPTYDDCLNLCLGQGAHASALTAAVARFFIELALYDRSFLTFPPLTVAVAAHELACDVTGVQERLVTPAGVPLDVFLLGWEADSLSQVKTLVLLLLASLTKVSEFVQKKHQEHGVCHAINQYVHRQSGLLKPVLDMAHAEVADADLGLLKNAQVNYIAEQVLRVGLGVVQPSNVLPSTPSTIVSHQLWTRSATPRDGSPYTAFSSPTAAPPYKGGSEVSLPEWGGSYVDVRQGSMTQLGF